MAVKPTFFAGVPQINSGHSPSVTLFPSPDKFAALFPAHSPVFPACSAVLLFVSFPVLPARFVTELLVPSQPAVCHTQAAHANCGTCAAGWPPLTYGIPNSSRLVLIALPMHFSPDLLKPCSSSSGNAQTDQAMHFSPDLQWPSANHILVLIETIVWSTCLFFLLIQLWSLLCDKYFRV